MLFETNSALFSHQDMRPTAQVRFYCHISFNCNYYFFPFFFSSSSSPSSSPSSLYLIVILSWNLLTFFMLYYSPAFYSFGFHAVSKGVWNPASHGLCSPTPSHQWSLACSSLFYHQFIYIYISAIQEWQLLCLQYHYFYILLLLVSFVQSIYVDFWFCMSCLI